MKLYRSGVMYYVPIMWAGDTPPSDEDIRKAAYQELRNDLFKVSSVDYVRLATSVDHIHTSWRRSTPYTAPEHSDTVDCCTCLDVFSEDERNE